MSKMTPCILNQKSRSNGKAIPSKSISYLRVIPMVFDAIENFSLPPNRIISNASLGIDFIASLNLNLYRSAINCNCLKIQLFFSSPRGIIPPFLMEVLSFGITLLKLISLVIPRPLHFEHAPFGELKEKVFGSGFG